MKASPGAAQALRNQAATLRQLATLRDAQEAIDRETVFELDGTKWHNGAHVWFGSGGDMVLGPKGPEYRAPSPITPMELIDDACAFEAIAAKLQDDSC